MQLLQNNKPHTINLDIAARITFVLLFVTCLFVLGHTLKGLVTEILWPAWTSIKLNTQDYGIYHLAAERFLTDSSTLYTDASKQSQIGFIYPPLSILIFIPFTLLEQGKAFVIFVLIGFIATGFCSWSFLELGKIWGNTVNLPKKGAIVLVTLSLGAVYHNALAGQVNAIVLALCLAFIVCTRRKLPILSGLWLAMGIWIKIYPALLLLLSFRNRNSRHASLATVFWLLALPTIFLPWLPFNLYEKYFFEILPSLSQRVIVNIINQSVTACLTRISLSKYYFEFGSVIPPGWVHYVNIGVMGLLLSLYGVLVARTRCNLVVVSAGILAIIPMVAPLGWGHTYVFAIPMYVLLLIHRSAFVRMITNLSFFPLLIPPFTRLPVFNDGFPLINSLFYSRYLLVTALLTIIFLVFEFRAFFWNAETQDLSNIRCDQSCTALP